MENSRALRCALSDIDDAGGASVAGCASRADQVTAQAQPVCEKEYRMGSNIPVVTCGTPLTAAERQRVAERLKSVVRTVPPGGPSKSGGP